MSSTEQKGQCNQSSIRTPPKDFVGGESSASLHQLIDMANVVLEIWAGSKDYEV